MHLSSMKISTTGSRSGLHRLAAAAATAMLLFLVPAVTKASDWPQIRGPERDGVARGETLSRAWGEDGPPRLWKRAIGDGFSGITVVGDRLYTMAAEGDAEHVLCLDAATGETIWQTPIGKRTEDQFGDGPRATPTVDGETLYAVSADEQLAALDRESGDVLWKHDLPAAFEAKVPRFGYASSPLVDGDVVLLDVGGAEGHGVVAFDKTTGEVRWTGLEGTASHSSPIVVELGGRKQYVFNRRQGLDGPEIVAIAPGGEVLWRHASAPDTLVMPIFVAPDRFFISSAAMGDGGVMIRVRTTDDGTFETEEVWKNHRLRNHFNTSVIVGGHLYGFDNATLRVVDVETGELRWAMRGFGKGNVVAAGDLLVILSDDGDLALAEATPEEYRELGRVEAMEGRSWTAPTLAGGRLFVRDHDEMVAYALSDEAVAAQTAETAAAVLARYAEARGGLEAWRVATTLEIRGDYATFSQWAPFELLRRRGEAGDLYRFEHGMLGETVIKARGPEGLWWQFPILGATEPQRVGIEVYPPLLSRESLFEPPLLDTEAKGLKIASVGPGDLDGQPAIVLEVVFPDERRETWYLDAETSLELAVDATVHDFTQGQAPMTRRTFFDDFRAVGGLVLPHLVSVEFGARLEEMKVEEVVVGTELPPERFALPASEKPDTGEDGTGPESEESGT